MPIQTIQPCVCGVRNGVRNGVHNGVRECMRSACVRACVRGGKRRGSEGGVDTDTYIEEGERGGGRYRHIQNNLLHPTTTHSPYIYYPNTNPQRKKKEKTGGKKLLHRGRLGAAFYIHIYIHTCSMYVCIPAYVHIHIHTCSMYVCISTYVHIHIHTCRYTYTHTKEPASSGSTRRSFFPWAAGGRSSPVTVSRTCA